MSEPTIIDSIFPEDDPKPSAETNPQNDPTGAPTVAPTGETGEPSTPTDDTPAAPTSQNTPPAVDPQITSLLEQIVSAQRQVAAPAPEPKEEPVLSDEEFAKQWGIFDPTSTNPNFIRDFFRIPADLEPEALNAEVKRYTDFFTNMRDGIARQAIIGAKNLMIAREAELMKTFQPLLEHHQQIQQQQTQERFFSTYPVLKEEAFKPIIATIASSMAKENFTSETDFFKALAGRTEAFLKTHNPNFSLNAPVSATATNSPTGTTPKLPRSAAGSTGGTTLPTAPQAPQSAVDAIWSD